MKEFLSLWNANLGRISPLGLKWQSVINGCLISSHSSGILRQYHISWISARVYYLYICYTWLGRFGGQSSACSVTWSSICRCCAAGRSERPLPSDMASDLSGGISVAGYTIWWSCTERCEYEHTPGSSIVSLSWLQRRLWISFGLGRHLHLQ